MIRIEIGRAGSMIKEYKDDDIKDIMSLYFNHPIWQMKRDDPVPDMPLDIQIELINRCNLKCEYCSSNYQKRKKSLLEWDVLKQIIDEAAKAGICYFTICGIGEAALHPDLFSFCRYIREKKVQPKGLRVLTMMPSILISNGMWTSSQVEECIENPPDVLSLSLAGLTDEEIKQRRSPINLDLLWKNISSIYKGRKHERTVDGGIVPVIHLSTHIYPSEIESRKEDIIAFKNKWFEISDAIVIKPTMLGKRTIPILNLLYEKYFRVKENSPLSYANISETHFERTAPCFETSRRLSINSDGNVWCGHHLSEDFGDFLGNVRKQTIHEIWHSEVMKEYRQKVRSGIFNRTLCKTCGGEIREVQR